MGKIRSKKRKENGIEVREVSYEIGYFTLETLIKPILLLA